MTWEIGTDSYLPGVYFGAVEYADVTGDSTVVDFGRPMAKFRISILLKSGSGSRVLVLQLADDAAFTQNVRTLGDHVLTLPANPQVIVEGVALRGPQRYGRITMSGGAGVFDVRLEWSNS
jgi:hypothetical protein